MTMNFLKRMFGRSEVRSGYVDSGQWAVNGNQSLFSAGAVNPDTAEALSTVFACVTAISSAISALPARLYQNNGKTRQEVNTGYFSALIKKGPNPYQSWPEFAECLTAQILLRGNGLVEITYDRYGTIIGMRVIPWHWCNVQMLANGRLVYDVFAQPGVYSPENGRARRLLQDEVIHIRDRSD
ncbi:MAG: phage portal protein, partial [Clostridia bacterium]|nr:phage portal protein [Clostridia bacterium]